MSVQFYWLTVGILTVWRLSSLFSAEAGPWGLLERLRGGLIRGGVGDWVSCFYCSSVWISVPFAWILSDTWRGRGLLWPALSAGAIIIEETLHRERAAPRPVYYEDQEETHVLPQEPDATSARDS